MHVAAARTRDAMAARARAGAADTANAGLFEGSPAMLAHASHCGAAAARGVFATKHVAAGGVVLRSRHVAAAGHRKHIRQFCAHCLRFSEDADAPLRVAATCCGDGLAASYCSIECRDADAPLHAPHCEVLQVVARSKKFKREEASHVRLLLRMMATCAGHRATTAAAAAAAARGEAADAGGDRDASEDRHTGKVGAEAPAETVLGPGGAAGAIVDANEPETVPMPAPETMPMPAPVPPRPGDGPRAVPCGLAHVLCMMEDYKAIPGYPQRKRQRADAAKAFVALLPRPRLPAGADVGASAGLAGDPGTLEGQLELCPEFRSWKEVASLLARGPANEFGICDVDGETCGCVFYPAAAMVNHSCVPTTGVQVEDGCMVFYATQDLAPGDEITQSYGSTAGDGRLGRAEYVHRPALPCNTHRPAPAPAPAPTMSRSFQHSAQWHLVYRSPAFPAFS